MAALDFETVFIPLVLAGVIDGETPGSDALFYMQGYNELVIVLEELLDALPPEEPNG